MKKIRSFFRDECRGSLLTLLLVALRAAYIKVLFNKIIFAHNRVMINGLPNLSLGGPLSLGLTNAGFVHKLDATLLNIKGKLTTAGSYRIARGCRIDIGPNGRINIGRDGYINANTQIIIMHSLTIGDNSMISWNCHILDENFHTITYENKKESKKDIVIGSNVWIGCGVKIYAGTHIPNGCVVGADSVLKQKFTEENCLIAGNPAQIVKRNVTWQ